MSSVYFCLRYYRKLSSESFHSFRPFSLRITFLYFFSIVLFFFFFVSFFIVAQTVIVVLCYLLLLQSCLNVILL